MTGEYFNIEDPRDLGGEPELCAGCGKPDAKCQCTKQLGERNMKKIQNLDEADLDAIAEEIFRNTTWFDYHGNMITLAMLRAEIIGAAYDRAERCDAANEPCQVGE